MDAQLLKWRRGTWEQGWEEEEEENVKIASDKEGRSNCSREGREKEEEKEKRYKVERGGEKHRGYREAILICTTIDFRCREQFMLSLLHSLKKKKILLHTTPIICDDCSGMQWILGIGWDADRRSTVATPKGRSRRTKKRAEMKWSFMTDCIQQFTRKNYLLESLHIIYTAPGKHLDTLQFHIFYRKALKNLFYVTASSLCQVWLTSLD